MAFHQLVRLSILTVLVYQVATESRHGPSNPETQRVDALFDTFSEASSDSLRQFKRQFDKSFERQSQLLQFDGTDKPDSSNGKLLLLVFFIAKTITLFCRIHFQNPLSWSSIGTLQQ